MKCKVLIFDDLKNDLNVLKVEKQGNKVFVTVKNKLNRSRCPSCHKLSKAVHSYYSRKVLDLPILGTECWMILMARKFYCQNKKCLRKIFSERFDSHFSVRKRMTQRVEKKI
jgi:transposase